MNSDTGTTNGNGSAPHAAGEWRPESPFLPAPSGEAGAATLAATAPRAAFGTFAVESPFRAEFEGEGAAYDPQAAHFASLLGELYDREFEEALVDLVNDGSAVLATREEHESGDPARDHEQSERVLREYYEPLAHEAHALLDRMSAELGEADLAAMAEGELDARLERFAPPPAPGDSEAFEHFLGKLLKKAKRAVRGAARLAKKVAGAVGRFMPINLVLGKLKALVRPLLERVLRTALDKLPVALRPAATQLAQRLFGIGRAPAARAGAAAPAAEPAADAGGTDAAAADATELQHEFDALLAGSIVAGEAFESEVAARALALPPARGPENALRDLRGARARFARRVVEMREGEDPLPEVEQFLPAVLTAARVGIKLVGRPRVVGFLAGQVARLISRYVGREQAAALSRSLVDSGLRLVSLEASDESEHLAAGYTLASTVENTVNHLLAAVPEGAWQNEPLLESYAQEAFERAAAAAFPDSHIREELREAAATSGAWVLRPALSAYEKFSAVPQVTITPQQARDVRTFGGDALASVFRNQLGIPENRTVTARMHLYRAVPGTTLADVARRETRVRGLGSARREAWSMIHPLTRDAARVLLGEPDLGADVDPRFLVKRELIDRQQRFYYLEIPDASVRVAADAAGALARTTQASVVLDFPAGELRLFAYFGEADAQQLAARARSGDAVRTLPAAIRPALQERLRRLLSGAPTDRVRIVHEAVAQGGALPAGAGPVLAAVGPGVVELLVEWTVDALRLEIEQRADRFRAAFVAAADAPADGLTIRLRVRRPGFLPALRALLAPARPLAPPAVALPRGFDDATVEVKPGFAQW